jgi:hypothetical protein
MATKTRKTRASLDESAKATLALAERSHLPQKINPGKVKEYSDDNTPDLCTHPMREDVKQKHFSTPLRETSIGACI